VPSAAILAGGQATRFGGRDKSALVVGGQSILARQVEALSQCADDILLVGSTHPRLEALGNSVRRVADRHPGRGPLAGLDAALAAARHRLVAVVACDMPFVTSAFFDRLFALAAGFDAVVPELGGKTQPLCAVYARSCAPAVARCLAEDRLAVRALLGDLRVRVLRLDEAGETADTSVFTNINTLEDLSSHQSPS
jgi:molybdopterin-guanine dinucleotide biosynthesis protein A